MNNVFGRIGERQNTFPLRNPVPISRKINSKVEMNKILMRGPERHHNSTRKRNKQNTHAHCLSTVNTAETSNFYNSHIYCKKII